MKRCSNCKQWKDENEFSSFKYFGMFPLCCTCLRVLSQRECKKRHQRKPKYRISRNLGTGIRKSLRTGKGGSWEKVLGYTLPELKAHLEKQFVDGMSWDNYGKWHIDHIKPVATFNFTKPEGPEFKQCWALSNLQPLWAADNWRKRKRYKSKKRDEENKERR